MGWHAGDGRKATGGNETTLSIEIIMDGSGSKEDRKAEENGVLLAALLLKKHGLSVNELYTHNHWMGHRGLHRAGREEELPAVHPAPLGAVQAEGRRKAHGAERRRDHHGGGQDGDHGQGQGERAKRWRCSPDPRTRSRSSRRASLEQLAQFFLEEGEAEACAATSPLRRASTRRAFFKYGGIVLPRRTTTQALGR